MATKLELDTIRYANVREIPLFQKYFRKTQQTSFFIFKFIYKALFKLYKKKNLIDLSEQTEIGEGLYFGHPYCITINPQSRIGKNVNIHKGVTIGQENRGSRRGTPVISDNVWIGINSTIEGNIHVGSDVLIAPNSFVNCDVPDHSIVFGNPCVIKYKDNATGGYINRTV